MKFYEWLREYEKISKKLSLDTEADRKARDVLHKLLNKNDVKELEKIKNSVVIIFGAGPSLSKDLNNIMAQGLHKKCVLITADGATTPLVNKNIIPDFIVTDLDGDMDLIIKANKLGAIPIVHAHGDNIEKLKKYVPKLKRVIGTTQVEPTSKVHNFFGFTDGDRCVFLAVKFSAKYIGLAGMDFGKKVGRHSKKISNKKILIELFLKVQKKIEKLRIGKMLIERIAKDNILNMTGGGVEIRGVKRVSAEEFKTHIGLSNKTC